MKYVLLIVSIVLAGCSKPSNKERLYSCITPQGVLQVSAQDERVVQDTTTYLKLYLKDYDIDVSIPKSLCIVEEKR